MNRKNARIIAEKITNQQLKEVLERAKEEIKDWTAISAVNKGITKGTAWNILAADFDVNKNYHILAKINIVREFSKFLPEELLPAKKIKKEIKPIHQNPNLIGWKTKINLIILIITGLIILSCDQDDDFMPKKYKDGCPTITGVISPRGNYKYGYSFRGQVTVVYSMKPQMHTAYYSFGYAYTDKKFSIGDNPKFNKGVDSIVSLGFKEEHY